MSVQPPAPDPPPPPPHAPPPPYVPLPYGHVPQVLYPYAQVPYYGQPVPANGIGTAGGVVGIVAVVLFWIPILSGIMGIVAVSLGGVGLQRANRWGGAAKGMAVTGIVCGAIAIVFDALFIIGLSIGHGAVVVSP